MDSAGISQSFLSKGSYIPVFELIFHRYGAKWLICFTFVLLGARPVEFRVCYHAREIVQGYDGVTAGVGAVLVLLPGGHGGESKGGSLLDGTFCSAVGHYPCRG